MSTVRRFLALLSVVVLASCDVLSGIGDVTLRVTEDTYGPNEVIRIELFNGTGDDIRTHRPSLEIARAAAWEHVRGGGGGFGVEGVPTFGAIDPPGAEVDAGDVHLFSEVVDDGLEAGRYRLTVAVWAPASAENSRTVISNEFTIVR